MVFSWACYDDKENEIFSQYILSTTEGLGPSEEFHTPAPYSMEAIRAKYSEYTCREPSVLNARMAILEIQDMLVENLDSLKRSNHCKSCSCYPQGIETPYGWNRTDIEDFLRIPIFKVHRIEGGY